MLNDDGKLTIREVASIAHQALSAYELEAFGKRNDEFDYLPVEEAESFIQKVRAIRLSAADPNYHRVCQTQHDKALAEMLKKGWSYGQKEDQEAKVHPKILPYSALPKAEKVKDFIFRNMVVSLMPVFGED